MKQTMAAIAAGVLLAAAPVGAQAGLFFGAHATGASLTNQNGKQSGTYPVEFGSGYGMHAGLWFSGAFGGARDPRQRHPRRQDR